MNLRRNVLIFHAGALGDFVLSWPLAVALGRLFPQSRIIYVTASSKGDLAREVIKIEAQDSETGWPALFGDVTKLPEAQRKTLASAQAVYTFVSTESDEWVKNVRGIAGEAPVVCLRTAPIGFEGQHASEYLLQQIPDMAVRTSVGQILSSIAVKGLGTLRGANPTGPVLVHPGSGHRDKCWLVEKFIELHALLALRCIPAESVIGPVERERMAKPDLAKLSGAAALREPATYVALAKLLASARAFIGNDSGPTHLAAILGVPTLALFGPTIAQVWKPLGPTVMAVQVSELQALTPDVVAEELLQLLQ